jgi:hypothetical protein
MPNYRVFYSFTCPDCQHKNLTRDTTDLAQDKEDAALTVHRRMTCLKCGKPVPAKLPFTFTATEV